MISLWSAFWGCWLEQSVRHLPSPRDGHTKCCPLVCLHAKSMVTWSLKKTLPACWHWQEARRRFVPFHRGREGFTRFLKSVSYEKGGQGPRIKNQGKDLQVNQEGFTSFLKSVSYEKGGQGPRIKKTLNLSRAAGKNEATLDSKKRREKLTLQKSLSNSVLKAERPHQKEGEGAQG